MYTAPAAAAAEPPSEPARIINTFVAPSKTFTDLNRSAKWWAPFILIAIFSYVLVFAVVQKIGFEQVTLNQMQLAPKRMEKLEQAPPEQRQRAIDLSVSITKGISYAIPVVNLLYFMVVAAMLMASFNFGAGAEIKFAKALAVCVYAYLPGVLKGILATISIYAGVNPDGFNFQNPVATNPGALVDPVTSPGLYTVASSVDIFGLWSLMLMAIGFSCVSKLKRSTTFGVVFGWWAVILLVRTAWAAFAS
jgi:hypothetical protein